ncbi:sulfite reductase flavoprotein subunit alpha [Phaeobacter sp. B1627]|uniref:diflavin oxidoreductase n=1 Tax=Phaeobacter sp. B1627 TaxID=2583809 RepID=UPI00159ED3D5|nr:flavodoxin domain-containing protein [Phaeobacter sp. B1627]
MTKQDRTITTALADAIGRTEATRSTGLIAEDAPFDRDQRNWLNGLLSGLQAIAMAAENTKDPGTDAPATTMTILFGSQSGTCESLSKDLRKFAKTKGFDAKVAALDDFDVAELAGLQHLTIIAATFGEGEPADNAVQFHAALMAEDAPALPASLNFAVCGLGDTSYAGFNQAARELDARLAALGATRVHDLVACDVAYEDAYAEWKSAVFASPAFAEAAGASQAAEPEAAGPLFDKNRPFAGTLMHVEKLSGAGSAKTVNHIEISLAGGGADMDYQVGDALGLWPTNCPVEVSHILQAIGASGAETVMLKDVPTSLRAALLNRLDLTTVTPAALTLWKVEKPTEDAQIIDVIECTPLALGPQELVDGLRPLQPRLYSIASSPKAHPGEVHLTVGEVHYELRTRRKGVASTYLGQRLQPGGQVGVYIQKSAHFHLPADPATPVIMIGPGTGIAPFRAFLEERAACRAEGPNWLFFGDQHQESDFLYQSEIVAWEAAGVLTRTSLAWSRDTAQKVYVQDLIRQDGAEFYDWLTKGAAIFVCGDATRMAADVDRTICEVIAQFGGLSEDEAKAYLAELGKAGRYQRDVY